MTAPQPLNLPQPGSPGSAGLTQASSERALDAYGKLPLSFVPNAGQTDRSVRYSAQGAGFGFYFTQDKAVLAFQKGERGHALDLRFVGANPNPELVAAGRQGGTVNYLVGSDHHAGLPTYDQIVYRELWPGIDMVFRGQDGTLKYEFHLAPGADPSDIRLAYHGADGVSLGAAGTLLVNTRLGPLTDERPQSFQRIDGRHVPVDSRYALTGSSYGFTLGGYDTRRPLVIDPGLAYSTYLGGSNTEQQFGGDVAVDSAGNAYVTGSTRSTDFPTTTGAFDTMFNGGFDDVFVTKLNAAGSALVYSTYLGGSGFEEGLGIAVDPAGAAYVTGATNSSTDFPTTPGAFDTSFNGVHDVFVTKLDATGSALAYSTFLGGSGEDTGRGIALDSAGAAYLTGNTTSGNFPTTGGAFDTSFNGGQDVFMTKLNAAGSSPLVYSTFLGGSGFDTGFAVAVDSVGAAYVTGPTNSLNFPTTAGAFDTSFNGGSGDAFVTKLNATGSAPLVYSTYLGGSGDEPGNGGGVAVDSLGAAYVTGDTTSLNFPTTAGAFDTTLDGGSDAFVTKLNAAGSTPLVYSTYLGGSGFEVGRGVAVDSAGAAHVTGATGSTNFPTPGAFDATLGGASDAFVTKLDPAGSSVTDSTYLGGSASETGFGIALDSAGAYVTGATNSSTDFPTTGGAFDTMYNGNTDAFVTKLTFAAGPGAPATLTLEPPADTNDVDTEHCVTATVEDAAGNPTPDITVRFTVTGSVNTSGSATTDANGEATFCYQGPELPGTDAITSFADTDDDNTHDPTEPSGAATKAWTPPVTTPLCQVNITKGGRITANNGDKATFGGNAQSDAAGNVKGQQEYRDHGPAQPQRVKSIEILALTCNQERTQATIFGRATIDGQGSHQFRIDVKDLAEPGVGQDTYRILLSTGYDSGSHTLEGGNIQIH